MEEFGWCCEEEEGVIREELVEGVSPKGVLSNGSMNGSSGTEKVERIEAMLARFGWFALEGNEPRRREDGLGDRLTMKTGRSVEGTSTSRERSTYPSQRKERIGNRPS